MEVNFTSRGADLPAKAKDYCQRRIKTLEKKLKSLMEINVVYNSEKYRHRVELKVRWKGGLVTVEAENEDLLTSFGEAFDQLEKRLRKEKEKQREKKRRASKGRERPVSETQEFPPAPKRVIPSHDFSLKPMDLEEAIFQMESKRRDVFLFFNQTNGRWNVVYRRRDGHFGLINPE